MRAFQVLAPGRTELVETDDPAPGPGEVLLQVAATGVCHSDVFIRQAPPMLGMSLPVTLGHEIVGVVREAGPGGDWAAGSQVAVYVLRGCGSCSACKRGADNLCRTGYRGIGTHTDGGLAEFVVVPARNLVDASGLDATTAAPLTDAGLTAFHSVRSAASLTDDWSRTLVIGVGGLGHLALQMVLATTEAEVITVDAHEGKLELAARLGAHHVVPAGAAAANAVRDLVHGREIDVVLDFVGADDTLDLAAQVTNRGSAIVVAGLGGGALGFEATSAGRLMPEVALRRVSAGSRTELAELFELVRRTGIRPEVKCYPLDRAAEAVDAVEAGRILGRAVVLP
ncbi:alcohol dehydrogenase catalytic domain-containing protein [Actinomadura physcomitrii]|nr:alcohol dehydrogenase catalytic domain-containing protein [Actinomadura physcomitrii]